LFLRRGRRRNHELQALRQCAHATPAISCARPVLYQSTRLAADYFPVHLKRVHLVFIQLCRHRCSLLTLFSGVRIGEERRNVLTGEDSYWRDGSIVRMPFSCQEYFCTFFRFAPVLFSFYAPFSLSFRPVSPPFCLFSTKPCVLPIFPPHLSWAFLRSFCGCGRVSFLFTSHESLAN